MAVAPITLQISIEPWPGADSREVAELTAQLYEQISYLKVQSTELPEGLEAPSGAKGVNDPLTLGTIVVTAVTSARFLNGMCSVLQAWLSARGARTLKITMGDDSLELTGASSEEQRVLTQAWIERHSVP